MARIRCCLLLVLGLADLVVAQGSFVNFEEPQVAPITVLRVGGHDYLAVCNTPNNSVEIYNTSTNARVTSFRTGQGPVTVRYAESRGELFTANFIGDSVTVARVIPETWGGLRSVEVRRTSHVGDEPCDIAFFPDDRAIVVTMSGFGALAWYDADNLRPIGGQLGGRMDLTFPWFSPAATKALKEPRRILWDGQLLLTLGSKGGNTPAFDFDLWGFNLSTFEQSDLGGLGSTNHAMLRLKDGRLLVVGTMARNDLIGEAAVRAAPTGFVESWLWTVDRPGRAGATVQGRDLNRDRFGSVVAKTEALSQPTDVAVSYDFGGLDKVFVAGFHSDRVGVLHADGGPPSGWRHTRIDIPVDYQSGYLRNGPRGLAFKDANPAQSGDPGARLYVLNRLSNSVSVVDPAGERELTRFPLARDPTPTFIRIGRSFLYNADLSGNGIVACTSCHVDARSDSLGWNLGVAGSSSANVPINPFLVDGVTGLHQTQVYPDDKGVMTTQSLQGLVTHPVNPEAQRHFSNAPFHWRGDRDSVNAFNSAFVTLMGAPNQGTPQQPKGLSDGLMQDLVDMIHSIVLPPNREQWLERTYVGDLGDPDQEDGADQLRGLKLFHTAGVPAGITGGRSCVQCHWLPGGSNRRITSVDKIDQQPTLTAGLRNLAEREAVLERSAFTLSNVKTGGFGLFHFGRVPSINHFVFAAFRRHFNDDIDKITSLTRFIRAYDTGTAPMVGAAFTINRTTSAAETAWVLGLLDREAGRANIGVAVHARLGGVQRGFFYDLTSSPPVYRDVQSFAFRDRAGLLSDLRSADDLLVFQATPPGSERRLCSPTGGAGWIPGPIPSSVSLEPMAPNSAWAPVTRLTKNWAKGTGAHDFRWDGEILTGYPVDEPRSLQTLRIYQQALINKAPQFGLTAMRHEAPRRFAVMGRDIRPGAVLELRHATDPALEPFVLELFPTNRFASGRQRWETAAEASPLLTYTLLLGGPNAPDVQNALFGRVSEPPPPSAFNPVGWNQYRATVRNEDGTSATVTGALRIE